MNKTRIEIIVNIDSDINLFVNRFIKNKKRNLNSANDYQILLQKQNDEYFVLFCIVELNISYRELLIIKELYKRRFKFFKKEQNLCLTFQKFLQICLIFHE